MKQSEIIINGIVQGVGFRPFIARIAKQLNIKGTVKNSSGTVIIEAQAYDELINQFINRIKSESPQGSDITNISIKSKEATVFTDFTIIESEANEMDEIIIPPDMAVCDSCVEELFDMENIRYRYPFISCVACGARYSIMKAVPYDRERTTMVEYEMCPSCRVEYESDTRRCYAQTISCHDCGPQLLFRHLNNQNNIDLQGAEALQKTVSLIKAGKIVAVKSIGGYNYVCRTDSAIAIKNLRNLKFRENKPFAIMFSDLEEVKKYCVVSEKEKKLLQSTERPIVLLERNEKVINEHIVKGSRYIGGFLPYTPLHYLLLKEFPSLIITSANHSDMPIITDDQEMLQMKSDYVAGVLYNTREIITPLDDSVTRVVLSSEQFMRRSRGYVPLPINLKSLNQTNIAAFGGDLKSSFCLLTKNKAYMSQYFGDMQNIEISDLFMKTYQHMTGLFHIRPTVIAVDKHPSYHSKALGESLGLKIVEVQHHVAHIYSVMAEHALNEAIGVAFDGTGYGDDGSIWGGEFFAVHDSSYKRVGHLKEMKLCGGDLAARDAKLLKYCYLYAMGLEEKILDDRFSTIKAALDQNINTNFSSSMGRLFDAVSSLLGIKNYNSYEGECAIALENCAYNAVKSNEEPYELQFLVNQTGETLEIDYFSLLRELINAKEQYINVNRLALGFHIAVADMILDVCKHIREKTKMNTVALSGGVFANKILLENTILKLQEQNFLVYFNQAVPMNDGGLALGQAYFTTMYLEDN